jgi:superfamily II DNA or RNA helicase
LKIDLYNVRAYITEATDYEYQWVSDYLTYSNKSYNPHRKRTNVTKVRMVKRSDGSFPSGLVPLVVRSSQRRAEPKFDVVVTDCRVKPAEWQPEITKTLTWLRKDQVEVLRSCYKRERGLLDLATAYGKTICSVALVESIPVKWVFVVASKSLLNQTVEKYEHFTGKIGEVGVIGDGKWSEGERLTVATVQTLYRNLTGKGGELLRSVGGIIMDEVHGAGAVTNRAVVNAAVNAYWRYGVSGTPLSRGDQKNLEIVGAFGQVIHRVKPSEAVEQGLTAKPIIEMHSLWQESERITWQGAYRECVVRSTPRNELLVRIAQAAPKPHMMFVKEVKHGRRLAQMLNRAGLRTEFVWGSKNVAQREAACERLVRGDIDVIVCSVIFQEGLDLPELRSGSIAGGGASTIATLQRLGRFMRKTKDKDEFHLYDIDDRGQKFLEKHSGKRKRAYEKAGFPVTIVAPDDEQQGMAV